MIKNKIFKLKKYFLSYQIDQIQKKIHHFLELYSHQFDRLKEISNFDGSAGLAIITKKQNYLFVDGRYTVQAKMQSGKLFKILDITHNPPYKILKNLKLGFDPKIFTKKSMERLFKKKIIIKEIERNLIDTIINKKIK